MFTKSPARERTSSPYLISHKKNTEEGGCRRTRCEQTTKSTHHLRFLSATHGLITRSLFAQGLEVDICSFIHFYGRLCCGRWPRYRRVSALRSASRLFLTERFFSSAGCRARLVPICSWCVCGLSDKLKLRIERSSFLIIIQTRFTRPDLKKLKVT